MPSTYSTSLRIELQADGENSSTWGSKANNDFNLFEQAIAGVLSKSVAGAADVTLTASNGASDESRNAVHRYTGVLTGNIGVIMPAAVRNWMVSNETTGSFSLTAKGASGTGTIVPQGSKRIVYFDGTNTVPGAPYGDGNTSDLKDVPGLKVSRIDPQAETAAYRKRIIERTGQGLDANGLALLEEDLRSPCTEEVAVFHAFSRIVSGAKGEIVVMDTAPTGHTLLLLDATGAYHREVMRNSGAMENYLVTPMMRLKDQNFTRVLLVTLAETTPVLEAAQLQNDLRRAGIEPYAWIINNSLAATDTTDPLLLERAAAELEQIREVEQKHAHRVMLVPWQTEEPVGLTRLHQLAHLPGDTRHYRQATWS